MVILYLTLNPHLPGPLPKIDPVLISALEERGCQVIHCPWGRHAENESLPQKIAGRLSDLIRVIYRLITVRPQILFVNSGFDEHTLARDVPLLLATGWSPAKKVVKIHGSKLSLFETPGNWLYRMLARMLIDLSDAILLLSAEVLKTWTRFESKGCYFLVENPIVLSKTDESAPKKEAHQKPGDEPILLFVGRLIKEKGIYELLDAFEIVSKQIECRLFIAGEGEEKERITRLIEEKKLGTAISLLGYLDEERLREAYQSASLFILPSYREGFPLAISEAMSYGLPIVTTPVGGIPDRLCEGEHVLYAKPKDAESVAGAVLRLLKDPDLCQQMGRANIAKIRELATDRTVPVYIDIFQKLLDA